MTQEQQQLEFDKFSALQLKTICSKREDYADKDVLSNFKLAGSICNISATRQCLSLIATKVSRLSQLIDGKEPMNEKTCDSCLDLANYAFLLNCILQDEKTNTPNN